MIQTAIPQVQTKDFLAVADFSPAELEEIIKYARELKAERKDGKPHKHLEAKTVAMYFEKPSNRTRVSFEVGIFDLGAHPIMLKKEEINLGIRETIADTARTLSRYVDAIMIRTFEQNDVEELARYATVPVINGLTDLHHPCQIVADLMTVSERLDSLKGKKLAYIGDGNNIAHSLLEGCALVGMDITIATPENHIPLPKVVDKARELAQASGSTIEVTTDVKAAVEGAHVVYTDVWVSMGQEQDANTKGQAFCDFQVNADLMKLTADGAFVLHCLPAHRGEEITADVFEQHADSIFDQAENRMHAQKAIMAALIK